MVNTSKTAKPTLGYPTRTAACVAMQAEGMPVAVIAHKVGISSSDVSALLCSARRQPHAARSVVQPYGLDLDFSVIQALSKAAAKRGITRHKLAEELLSRIVEDDLFEAVLDDAGTY